VERQNSAKNGVRITCLLGTEETIRVIVRDLKSNTTTDLYAQINQLIKIRPYRFLLKKRDAQFSWFLR